MLSEIVTLDVKLRAFVKRETKSRWAAVCPAIGVASQGRTQESAKRSLTEAVELWFESCIERGVLDRALREANFRAVAHEDVADGSEHVSVRRAAADEDELDVRGNLFPVQIAIPAYQAAALNLTQVE